MSLPKVTPWFVVFLPTLEHLVPCWVSTPPQHPKHLLSILKLVKQVCFTRLCYYIRLEHFMGHDWIDGVSHVWAGSYMGCPESYSLCFRREGPVSEQEWWESLGQKDVSATPADHWMHKAPDTHANSRPFPPHGTTMRQDKWPSFSLEDRGPGLASCQMCCCT